jgi:hypothetical protein
MCAFFVTAFDKATIVYGTFNHIPNIVMLSLLIITKATGFPAKVGKKYGKPIVKDASTTEKKIQ